MASKAQRGTPPDPEKFKSILKLKSLKTTPQRMAVHEAMLNLGHASADMVYGFIKEHSCTRVTTASVYNILTQLSDEGIYARRPSTDSKMFFDINTSSHIHLYDKVACTLKDVMDEELMSLVKTHLRGHRFSGFKVDDVEIQLICHRTRKRNTKQTK